MERQFRADPAERAAGATESKLTGSQTNFDPPRKVAVIGRQSFHTRHMRDEALASAPNGGNGHLNRVRQLPNAAKLSVVGLVMTAAGMLLQIGSGSRLYPSFAGPIVLLLSALLVALLRRRWTAYLAFLVPLVLGLGAVVAALTSGEFIDQLTDVGDQGIFLGSVLHVIGLIAAVAGGVEMLRRPQHDDDDG